MSLSTIPPMADVRVAPAADCAHDVAELVIDCLDTPETVIGLATGRSTVRLHALLVDAHHTGRVDLRPVRWLMLDELLDIDHGDPRGFRAGLMRDFVSHFDPSGASLVGPRLDVGDADSVCADFRRATAGMQPRIQVLGLGRNGHVGFNEPGSPPDSRVRVVNLAESTVADLDANDWRDETQPTRAVTRGIADIVEADTIILVAFGDAKAPAVRSMLREPISTDCPASLLREHRDLRVFLDADAARML